MIQTILLVALTLIALGKTRRNTSSLQQVALWCFIGLCMTTLGVLTWVDGKPRLDAEGTRQKMIEHLKVDDDSSL
ncbi:MAG: hypothetical protein ACFB0G_11295 [Leptolyngbyaceae cyanobacterium]